MKRKLLAFLLSLILACGIMAPLNVYASEIQDTLSTDNIVLNPLYDDIRSDSQTQQLTQSLNELQTGSNAQSSTYSVNRASTVYSTTAAAADYIKSQMVAREERITVSVQSSVMPDSVWDLFYEAMEYSESCTGQEGDALLSNYDGASASYSTGGTVTDVTFYVMYRTTAKEEAELTSAVNTALASMNLNGKTDYQKVRLIYDYICDNVDYDYEHLEAEESGEIVYYPYMYTAYGAMCDGKAVCQGYATLFYRMCKDAGLSVRFISGWAGGAHAWNIVKIGDEYYNLDCTWDGQDAESYHSYFLKSEADFTDHWRDSEYDSDTFHKQYPMTLYSWEDYSKLTSAEGLNLENIYERGYYNIDGGTVSNYADGKPKILVFGRPSCMNTQYTIGTLSNESFEDIDVVFIDMDKNDLSAVSEFRSTYGSINDDIIYAYNTAGNNFWTYVEYLTGNVNTITLPYIVYIDSDNMIQYKENGSGISGNTIKQHAMVYVSGESLVSLSNSSMTLNEGNTQKLDMYVYGMKRNAQFFTWSSSNTSVATVDANGKVTAKAAGTVKITCKINNNISVSCQVTVSGPYTGLKQSSNGAWYYYKNGVIDTTFTGLVQYGNNWWYVKNGKLNFDYDGVASNKNGTWYVENSKVDFSKTGLYSRGNKWYLFEKGKVSKTTTLANNSSGWWYVKNGQVDFSYDGVGTNNNGTWYIENGKVDFSKNGLLSRGSKWYLFENGKVKKTTTVVNNSSGWWYVKNGQVDFSYDGVGTNNNGTWYIENGKVDFSKNGFLSRGRNWYLFENGRVNKVTTLANNENGWWYVKNGKVDFSYTGKVTLNGVTYNIKNGKVIS